MSAGLSSHIKNDDYDVSPLTDEDFDPPEQENGVSLVSEDNAARTTAGCPNSHFYHLVELSLILAEILDLFFTIQASSRTRSNFSLSLELAKPLRTRLKQWKTAYDVYVLRQREPTSRTGRARLDGNASLGLAYPVATIILFRALLRPADSPSSSPEDSARMEAGMEAVRRGAKACCIIAVEFVESLKRNVWDAFWHSWSRAGFATVSSLIIRLLITSDSPEEIQELNDLIGRWRWALRTGGGSAGNVLMSLALLRLDKSLVTRGIHESDEGE